MNNGDGKRNTRIHGERGDTKDKIENKSRKKDWRFEERLAEKGESKIKIGLREINERGRKEVTWSKWEEQRRQVFEER